MELSRKAGMRADGGGFALLLSWPDGSRLPPISTTSYGVSRGEAKRERLLAH